MQYLIGNWKMRLSAKESVELAEALSRKQIPEGGTQTVIVCPSHPMIPIVMGILQNTGMHIGSQDSHWENASAATGAVSPAMLKELGCTYGLVGHSERRALFSETDDTINKKISALIHIGITPIVCVGETAEQKNENRRDAVLREQITSALSGIPADSPLIVAYEPRWAIGTGMPATPEDAESAHARIRETLQQIGWNADIIPVLYGGSVDEKTAQSFLETPGVNGVLLGGASVSASAFATIIEYIR